jgi:hypothetical protein
MEVGRADSVSEPMRTVKPMIVGPSEDLALVATTRPVAICVLQR